MSQRIEPYKPRSGRNKGKKGYKKRAPRTKTIGNSSRAISWPFPEKLKVNLRYDDTYLILCSSGSVGVQQNYMTSIYDPDYSGSGHQPYGYDQLVGMWKTYCVHKYYIKMNFTCTGGVPMRVVLEPKFNDATTVTNITLASERPSTLMFIVPVGQTVTRRFTCNLPKFGGLTLENYKNAFTGAIGSNPPYNAMFNIATQPADLVSTGSLSFDINSVYTVEFCQQVLQNQS